MGIARDTDQDQRGNGAAVSSLDYRRDFVFPIMTIIGVAALAISLMLLVLSIRADQQEFRTEQDAARIAIRLHLDEMKQYLTDCAAWDLGYTKLVLHLDPAWADQNIGPYLFKTQGFDNSFVTDPTGRTTYASSGSTDVHMDAFAYLGRPLQVAAAMIRRMPAHADRRYTGLLRTADGKVAAFAVAPIVPDTNKIASSAKGLSLLVLVDVMNPDDVDHIGLTHQLRDLRPTPASRSAGIVLADPQGRRIGGLSWTPRRPGAVLRYGGAPVVLAVIALLALAAQRVLARARRAQTDMQRLAVIDSLTGLSNRASFMMRLDELVAVEAPFALFSIDLDRFKVVNDQFGHIVGDEVLIEIARRLQAHCSPETMVARVGGDEFTLLTAGAVSTERAGDIASAIIAGLGLPVETERVRAHVGASVGVAFYPQDGNSATEVRQAVDLALYRAKQEGRGSTCFYNRNMDEAVRDRQALEVALRDALDSDLIGLAFQPVLSVSTQRVTSFEALARWTDPVRGPVPPSDFIGLAEESGLIEELGTKLLRKACAEAVKWPGHIRVAVNLSPLQFQSGRLCAIVEDVLADTGLPPTRLQLEVTESLLIRDVERSFQQLEQLRSLGIQILMDDFGVGYSSLSYFERFTFDKVKIDRSFIDTAPTSPTSQAVIKAVVQLGATLDIGIVAEGVETREQMDMLSVLGCTHAQGYLLGRPMTIGQVGAFISEDKQSDETVVRFPAGGRYLAKDRGSANDCCRENLFRA